MCIGHPLFCRCFYLEQLHPVSRTVCCRGQAHDPPGLQLSRVPTGFLLTYVHIHARSPKKPKDGNRRKEKLDHSFYVIETTVKYTTHRGFRVAGQKKKKKKKPVVQTSLKIIMEGGTMRQFKSSWTYLCLIVFFFLLSFVSYLYLNSRGEVCGGFL